MLALNQVLRYFQIIYHIKDMASIQAPKGLRFHPTDEELIEHYLRPKIAGIHQDREVIRELQICNYEPWELPAHSIIRSDDSEWFFFHPYERKYHGSSRINRITKEGYWKPTGRDITIKRNNEPIGMKKFLVFHKGRAPGEKTNRVMHEYRLAFRGPASPKYDTYVLCRLFDKSSSSTTVQDSTITPRRRTLEIGEASSGQNQSQPSREVQALPRQIGTSAEQIPASVGSTLLESVRKELASEAPRFLRKRPKWFTHEWWTMNGTPSIGVEEAAKILFKEKPGSQAEDSSSDEDLATWEPIPDSHFQIQGMGPASPPWSPDQQ